jgi:hypothetical protein
VRYVSQFNVYKDDETGLTHNTKQGLIAKVKRFNLDIPEHPYLSNRFVIEKVNYKRR